MNAVLISVTVLVVAFGGALLGMYLGKHLPDDQLSESAVSHIKTVVGLLTSMFALLLSLQLSSAKSSFDREEARVSTMSAMTASLDRTMAHYGPEANDARASLRLAVQTVLDHSWPKKGGMLPSQVPNVANEVVLDKIQALAPKDDAQRTYKAQAMSLLLRLGQMRWEEATTIRSSTAIPLMLVETSWVAIAFVSFGIFAPRNLTVITSMFICAAAVAAGFFLIAEMNTPYGGIIHVSSAPMREALAQMGQ